MRKIIALSILSLLIGCTVVPDPTAAGVTVANSDSASSVAGDWKASIVTKGTVFMHQLSLSTRASYLRTVHDSTPGSNPSRHLSLQEDGTWKVFQARDTSWLVLTPRFRQIGTTTTAVTPDTASWTLQSGTLHWNARNWNRRDTTESLTWTPD
ncbi:MAG: hypothetical protein AAB214_11180 [Fibrobacterota bacterium]